MVRNGVEDTDYGGDSLVDRTDILRRGGFSKSNHPLSVMLKYKRQELLEHPVVAALIHHKWRAFGIFSVGHWLLYLIHLILFTALTFTLPHPQNEACTINVNNISALRVDGSNITDEMCTSSNVTLYILALFVLLHSVFRLGLEIYQMIYSLKLAWIRRDKEEGCCGCCLQLLSFIRGTEYFTSWMNWVELPLFMLSTVFACATFSAVYFNECSCPYDWQWQIGVVVTWLTWIEFIVLSTQFRVIGVYTLMFVQVLKTFTKLALVALLLIVAFGLTFYFLLYNPKFMGSPYSTPGRSLLKVLAMMIGDVSMDSFFGLSIDQPSSSASHLFYPALTTITWLVSLVFLTIILANLLIGLAVGDIQTITKDAFLNKLGLQIDYILTMENQIPRCLRRCIQKDKKIFEPNNTSKREAFKSRLVYFLWGGIHYDSHEAIERLLPQYNYKLQPWTSTK